MGCTSSKLDDLPAVLLCRDRCDFLDEAIHQRYALAEAHVAYFQSLKAVGLSLHRFFDQDLLSSTAGPPSPVLNLPTKRKGDPEPSSSAAAIRHSHSHSGSHINFNSDSSDDEVSELDYHHHLDDTSPEHQHQHQLPYGQLSYADNETLGSYPGEFRNMYFMKYEATPSVVYQQRPISSETVRIGEFSLPDGQLSYADNETLGSYPDGLMNMNYMKNKATPSVVYEQRPMSSETMRWGESSSYSLYPYTNQNPSSYSSNGDSNYGGFYGSSQPTYGPVAASSVASSSKTPPPPPSPPSSSVWDFVNPFESIEKFYSPYTLSRDLKEVREEEGIPDLEDEYYYQQEVVKEVHGDEKFVNYSKAVVDDEDGKANNSEPLNRSRPSLSLDDDDAVEYEVHMVDKKVVDKKERSGDGDNVAAFNVRRVFRDDYEIVKEIKVQFERASELGSELAKMLEVGKLPHNRKHAAYQVPSKMLNVVTTPSLSVESSKPSTSASAELPSVENTDPAYLNIDEDVGMRSGNLSSTLKKLYLWEKKLYEEVKVEEKMRVGHERKCRKLKRLDERGAEAHKVDVTRTLVRSLSTKIKIAIQVVDKISVKINKLRDEELWPQLNEFIQGLTRMWKSMLECHHSQCQAIGEARRLDTIASRKHLSDARLDATLELEHELLNWTLRFSCWVGAQKGYVRALNNWLLKCLLYVPEETADGVVPFSPGRIGAPPVFVICYQWSQALEAISEKEVVDSMRELATNVLQLWEQDKLEMRQRMIVNKDMERKVKNLEMKDQKIQKEIQALEKRMVLASGDGNSLLLTGQAVYQSDTSKNSSLQVSLQHIFVAMDKFTTSSLKVYEELLQRIEEERLAQEREKVS